MFYEPNLIRTAILFYLKKLCMSSKYEFNRRENMGHSYKKATQHVYLCSCFLKLDIPNASQMCTKFKRNTRVQIITQYIIMLEQCRLHLEHYYGTMPIIFEQSDLADLAEGACSSPTD